MDNWSSFRGSRENTLTGLKHALEAVNKNAFVCVWTDELGDDNNDAALKANVLSLKTSTESEIFIMALAQSSSARQSGTFAQFNATFGEIGHVMDVKHDPDVVDKMINIMKKSALCNKNNTATTYTPPLSSVSPFLFPTN